MTALGPGTFVRCVNAGPCPCCRDRPPIQRGHIYTVTEVYSGRGKSGRPLIGLRLQEAQWSTIAHSGFGVGRFIPVDDSRLDIFRTVPADLDEVEAQ